jgi:hypothetical protein
MLMYRRSFSILVGLAEGSSSLSLCFFILFFYYYYFQKAVVRLREFCPHTPATIASD